MNQDEKKTFEERFNDIDDELNITKIINHDEVCSRIKSGNDEINQLINELTMLSQDNPNNNANK